MVDVSARARRRAALARVGEFVPSEPLSPQPSPSSQSLRVGGPDSLPLDDDHWFGTADEFPAPSAAPASEMWPAETAFGRPDRMRRLGIPEIESLPPTGPIALVRNDLVRDDQRPEELTGELAPYSDDLTGPLPVAAPVDDEPHTEQFAAIAPDAPVAIPAAADETPADEPPADETPAIERSAATRVPDPRRARTTTRVGVRATVLAVLLALVGGGASALAMDKTVVLSVDGQERTLHTFAGDVAGALAAAGLAPTPQDRVQPALPTDVADGDYIIVNRARPLTLVEGGQERQIWTTAASVQDALAGLGLDAAPIQMSASPEAPIPLSGLALELNIPRTVSLADGSAAQVPVTTMAGTVAGLLAEQGVTLGPDDVSVPSPDSILAEGTAIQIVRNGEGEVIETRTIEPPEQIVEDPEMPRGDREVVDPGTPGEQTAVVRVFVQNGQEVRRVQVRAGSTTPPTPRIVKVGTNDDVPQAPVVSDGGVWDRLVQCEATGNWAINTGNGYYGGLQFDRSTWHAYGGGEYADLPHQASREEQIAIATKVRDDRGGYGAWPACSRKLGLPR
ncbi:transglycosylase family protein [Pseudonocardia abyssalis]|uniref:Transglycosylase family protein n=2 Tax=Pseudonocardia abyssalis TaxID=2792008 RepID=A0ABS6UX88_9PSEU|nr:transglycosylase family protein [Pseudonocardia abyssalis]MBW0136601.1 transglycosylase family protein [Pseudonocardia abyssalis]